MVAAFNPLCSATVSVVSAGICHINEVNSIAWLYRKAQPKDSIQYITLHYMIDSMRRITHSFTVNKSSYCIFNKRADTSRDSRVLQLEMQRN